MNAPRRAPRRHISGVLLLDKPAGLTSNAALQKVRWLFNAEKAGHTGALDPLATGLLPLCLGEASKFSHHLLEADKRYEAIVQLGQRTTTGDREGEIIDTQPVPRLAPELVQSVLASFLGDTLQIPPMYSALKQDGRPLYELARQGIEVERAARPVHISFLQGEVLQADTLQAEHAQDADVRDANTRANHAQDTLHFSVQCSKGTYIRTLGEDLAAALGTCGHLIALRRTRTGPFDLSQAVTIEQLEAMVPDERDALLLPVDAPVAELPAFELDRDEAHFFMQGQALAVGQLAEAPLWRIFGPDQSGQPRFLGLALRDRQGRLQPKRLVVWHQE